MIDRNENMGKLTITLQLLIIALFSYATISGDSALWGFNLLKFYPQWLRYSALGLVAVVMIITTIKSKEPNNSANTSNTPNTKLRLWLPALIAILLIAAFFAFPSVTTFLGDGHLRTNQLRFGKMLLAPEPLDFLVHALAHQYLTSPLGYQPIATYQIISALSGVVFLWGIWRLAKVLTGATEMNASVISVSALLLSSGAMTLFFGYIESYSILLALIPHLLTNAIDYLEKRSGPYGFFALFLLAALTHTIGLLLLGPLAVFVFLCSKDNSKDNSKENTKGNNILKSAQKYTSTLVWAAALGIVALVVLASLEIATVNYYILKLLPESNTAPALLTLRHGANLLNWSLLAALPVFLLIPRALRILRDEMIWENSRALVGIWLAIPALVFSLIFIPQLTGPRDWDLFAIPAYALLLAAVLLTVTPKKRFTIRPLLAPLLISWIMIAAFAGINHSVPLATNRFVDILEYTSERNLFKEYNLLSAYAKDYPSIEQRRLEFLQKAWEQPPYLKRDSALTLNKLGEEYMKQGNLLRAEEALRLSLKVDNQNLYTYQFLINLYRSNSSAQQLKELGNYMSGALLTNARGQMDAGQLLAEAGEMKKAGQCFSRAYSFDSLDVFVVVNLGVFYLRTERLQEAKTMLEKATLMKPNYYTAAYNLTLVYLQLNDRVAALETLNKATKLATTPLERSQIQKLQNALRR